MERLPWILQAQGTEGIVPIGESKVVSGIVATVNLLERRCTTTEGETICLESHVDEMAAALKRGRSVRILAEGIPAVDGLIATRIKVKVDPPETA